MNNFSKYQALGNDYLILDPRELDFELTPETVRMLCDRNFGIGADGVVAGPCAAPGSGAPLPVDIFNSDGSTCPKSGNGLRMFALHLAEQNTAWQRGNQTFDLAAPAGTVQVRVTDLTAGEVSVDMGAPSFSAEAIPMLDARLRAWNGSAKDVALEVDGRRLMTTSLSIGTPHTVVPMKEVNRRTTRELGPQVARHQRFPAGSNVAFMRVVNRSQIDVEIWERAAGYTMASGASACAAAIVAAADGLVEHHVTVRMPGGSIDIRVDDTSVSMTGAVERVMDGVLSPSFSRRLAAQSSVVRSA